MRKKHTSEQIELINQMIPLPEQRRSLNKRYLIMGVVNLILLITSISTFRLDSLRLFLGPVTCGLTIVLMGYSSTLKSFLVVEVVPRPINLIQGGGKTLVDAPGLKNFIQKSFPHFSNRIKHARSNFVMWSNTIFWQS